jgi:hypothetical protein
MSSIRNRLALAIGLAVSFAPVSAQQLKSTVWWDASEAGWGLYIADQGNVLVPFWFTHDSDGEPVWFLAPTTRQADGSYRGEFERITGVPLAQIQGQAADPGTPLGSAVLEFSGDDALQFSYSVGGQTQVKQLTRFAFGDKDVICRAGGASRASSSNYSDIWWSPDSSGWGVHISHLDNDLYLTWYTYDTDREPVFFQGVTVRQADGSFAGELYRSNDGTPFSEIDGAPANDGAAVVGSVRLRFADGENASFEYTAEGVSQSKPIQRFLFGDTASVCSVETFGGDDGGGGGGGPADACFPPYAVGDVREVRFDEGEEGEGTRTERVVGSGSFEGQDALVEEISGQTSAGNGVYARNYVQNGNGSIVSFGAEAFDPGTGQLIARSVNDPIRIERPRAYAVGQSHELSWTVRSTATVNGTTVNTTEQLRDKVTLLARETISVEAGTFSACKFEVETDLDSNVTTQGVNVVTQVRRSGLRWTSPQFGLLKMEDSGTVNVTTMGFTQSTEVQGSLELISATVGGVSTP